MKTYHHTHSLNRLSPSPTPLSYKQYLPHPCQFLNLYVCKGVWIKKRLVVTAWSDRPLIGERAILTSLAVELITLTSAQTSVLDITCRLLRKLASGWVTASMQTHVSSTVRPVSNNTRRTTRYDTYRHTDAHTPTGSQLNKPHENRTDKKLSYRRGTARRAMLVILPMFHEVFELERFQTAKVIFNVIQGHWQWCHSIGHVRFPITLPSLISQNLKRPRDPEHAPFGGNLLFMHYYTSVSISSRRLNCLVSPTTKIWLGSKCKKTDHVTLTTPTSVILRLLH